MHPQDWAAQWISARQDPPMPTINVPDRCEECGFVQDAVTPENAEETIRALGRRYRAPLTRLLAGENGDDVLRHRPTPGTWSAVEYAAHVRDVIALWGSTLHLTLTREHSELPQPDPDLADQYAAERDYHAEDPTAVADGLAANADRMANKVATIRPDQWDLRVRIGDEAMTVLGIVRKVAHEGGHHLLDIGRSLRAARSGAAGTPGAEGPPS